MFFVCLVLPFPPVSFFKIKGVIRAFKSIILRTSFATFEHVSSEESFSTVTGPEPSKGISVRPYGEQNILLLD